MSDLTMKGKQQIEHVSDSDCISRQAVKDALTDKSSLEWELLKMFYPMLEVVDEMPPTQPESYKVKLKEIADALSEKFAYMNTCLNERDIILGYLGVKRRCETHCNSDCTNAKCESHPLSSVQSEQRWTPCSERMPEDGKWCLFTDGVNMSVERYKEDALDHFFPPGRWFSLEDAIAWMPLPKPYRKGGLLQ